VIGWRRGAELSRSGAPPFFPFAVNGAATVAQRPCAVTGVPLCGSTPYGRVPTLVEDDFVLYESTAILEYLENTHQEKPLIPPDARGCALIAMHMKLCDIQLARQTGTIIFPKRFLPKDKWDEKAMAQAKSEIEKHLAILETQLAGKEWMVGDRYSLVEVCYTPFVEFLGLMEVKPPPGVAAWVGRMLERPSAKETKPAV
jgi:glutathione S-transferase